MSKPIEKPIISKNTLMKHLDTKGIGEKTKSGYLGAIKRIIPEFDVMEFKTINELADFLEDVGAEEIIKRVNDTKNKETTLINYYKALKCVCINYEHPKKDWSKIIEEKGDCKEKEYLTKTDGGTVEELIETLDEEFNRLNSLIKKDEKKKSEYQKENWTTWAEIQKCVKNKEKEGQKIVDFKWGKSEPFEGTPYSKEMTTIQEVVLGRLYAGMSYEKIGKDKEINQPRRSAIIGHNDFKGVFHPTMWNTSKEHNSFSHLTGKKYGKWGQILITMRFHKNNPLGEDGKEIDIMRVSDIPTVKAILLMKKYNLKKLL